MNVEVSIYILEKTLQLTVHIMCVCVVHSVYMCDEW